MDILSSSMIYTYDVHKMQNSILNIPWFHTPASHFSRNGYDTMGDTIEQKLAATDSFRIFGGRCFASYLHEILTKHNIKETSSKSNIWGQFYIPKGEGLDGG